MEWFLENWLLCLRIIFLIGSIILALILFLKTRDIKYLKEVLDMIKYKTPTICNDEPPKAQSFPDTRPVYRLNKATGELELTDQVIDIQEIVESCKDTCLQACLERFIPQEEESEDLQLYSDMLDDLDVMRDVCERAESYREAFGLDGASVEEVFQYVGQHADLIKSKLDAENTKNGGFKNGKVQTQVKNDDKAAQGKDAQTVSQDGAESADKANA